MNQSTPPSFKVFKKEDIEQSISGRFEQLVSQYPQSTAISYQGATITYDQLNGRANQIARTINTRVKGINHPIALLIDQGVTLLAAILGVLKSRNIYVPIDSRQSSNIIAPTINDLQPKLIFHDSSHQSLAREFTEHGELVNVDEINTNLPPQNLVEKPSPDSIAYIYFTSGSTGKPKGVMDCHRNVLHNILRYTNTLKISPTDRLSLIQHSSFSGAVSSMFGALSNGATLCPCDVNKQGVQVLPAWIEHEGITIFHSVPSIFRHLAITDGNYDTVRLIRLEGDVASNVDARIFRKYFTNKCSLVNGMGITECGLVRQFFLNHEDPIGETLPIGYTVPDIEIQVCDELGTPVEKGIVGEIRVKSEYLALGYWLDPEKTSKAFGYDEHGSRIYKTGDLGVMDTDHCLKSLGRMDNQLKILGQTVNVTELELHLNSISGVRSAVIVRYIDKQHENQLGAYIVPSDPSSFSIIELKKQLTEQIPSYMIPNVISLIEKLPISPNGKIDRKLLPHPTFNRSQVEIPYKPPGTPMEKLLASIWSEVLEIHPVGVKDQFILMGGNSLKASRVVNQLTKENISISIVSFFEHLTLESLAQHLQNGSAFDKSKLSGVNRRAQRQRSAFGRGRTRDE